MMKKSVRTLFFLSLGWMVAALADGAPGKPLAHPADVAVQWADLTLSIILHSPSNSPTYSSRSLAYLGLTMYESVVHGSPQHRSLVGQVSGLTNLPRPDTSQTYNWPLVLNASQALLLAKLYPHADRVTVARIDSLQRAVVATYAGAESPAVRERSAQYGWALANAVFDWAKTDGGHEGFNRNFDPTYAVPTGNGYWVSPPHSKSASRLPLHVTWGHNRPFVPANQQLPVPPVLPYSTDSTSAYYREFAAVYRKSNALTREERNISIWWADDPAFTYSPPGHSYNLATTAIKIARSDLFKAAETYARVGMAVADAFINCWKCKYIYHGERPSTFIGANLAKDWKPFWPEPPFPAFPSGHATQSAAAATVLAQLYGDRFAFTDSTHYARRLPLRAGLDVKSRHFDSFWAAALECADSRFYGGIHTRIDNEVGLREGKKIGGNVNALIWRR